MPCLIGCLALLSPRLAIFVLWIATDLLSRAYDSFVIPLVGFFLLPWTTLGYAAMWAAGSDGVSALGWIVVAVAFLVDLSAWFGGNKYRSR